MVRLSQRFPALTVSTPRLLIRSLGAADVHRVAEIFGDRQTQRWLPFVPPHTWHAAHNWCTSDAAQRRETGDGDHYAVVRRDDGILVGCMWAKHTDWAGLITEISYAVAPGHRGMGLATEAAAALAVDLLAEHGFERVEQRIAPGNTSSRRVAEKAGFVYEGVLRNAGYVHGGRVDLELWSLTALDLRRSAVR